MLVKTIAYSEADVIESRNSPAVAKIINDINALVGPIHLDITGDDTFTVTFVPGVDKHISIPPFCVSGFVPSMPTDRTWTPEEFEQNKAEYRQREDYERKYFMAGSSCWTCAVNCLEGIFVWLKGEKREDHKAMRVTSAQDVLKALQLFQEEDLAEEEANLAYAGSTPSAWVNSPTPCRWRNRNGNAMPSGNDDPRQDVSCSQFTFKIIKHFWELWKFALSISQPFSRLRKKS